MSDTTARQQLEDALDLRVILVGAGPLDANLRRDPGIELIRSRSALDALGELANPLDDRSPAKTAVIIGPGAAIADDEAPELVAALRLVNPEARVLGVSDTPEVNGAAAPFDALAPADIDGVRLRSLLGSLHKPADRLHDVPTIGGSPPPQFDGALPPDPAAIGDPELMTLTAVLAGVDPLTSCMEVVRARLGAPDASFLAQPLDGADPAPTPDGARRAAVERRGRRFGWLESWAASAGALAASAVWLAHWLALAEQQRQLREAAFTDSLTGAWNRRHFDRVLPMAIEKARARRHDLTLLLFDIDDFKVYNDRFGHGAGDEILQESVRLLKSVIRPTDRVFRIGGDEFAVVFDDPDGPRTQVLRRPLSISEIASRFQKQVCEHRFPKLGSEAPSTLTISGGLATFPWDAHSAETLLERADQLAMESKKQGKNAITFGPGADRVCRPGEEVCDQPSPG